MRYVIFLFTCLISFSAYSQMVSIYDNDSKEPIQYAVLISSNPQASVITNSKGQAEISILKDAEMIEVQMLGYKKVVYDYKAIENLNFVIYLEKTNLNLDEVVVSASRWRQRSRDIPSEIISIMPKDVELQNPQTAADLLGISGKVFIQKSQQGGGSPMIRGFATNRLLYSVDGVRMNNAIFRGGNIQNVISLDPFAMEHTEVFFGPGSVIYGSDAIGGVMSFQTIQAEVSLDTALLIKGNATLRYSSVNSEKTGHFNINIGNNKWAIVSSASSFNFEDLKQGSKGPEDYIKDYFVENRDSADVVIKQDDPLLQVPSAYSQINLMQKIRFYPNEKWDFEYGFHYSETSPYGRYDRHLRTRDDLPRYGEWTYGPQKWMMNLLRIEYLSKNLIFDNLNIRMAHQQFEETRISRDFNNNIRSIRTEKVLALSTNIDFLKNWGSKHQLYYGFEYVVNFVDSKGEEQDIFTGIKSKGPSRYPESNWQSIGVYINNQFHASDQLVFQTGLRYNLYSIESEFDTTFYPLPFTEANLNNGALTGSLGLVYKPADDWVFRTNLATAFRSPNVDDMGKIFDSEPGSVVIPNPELKAEYAYSADIGLAKVAQEILKIDLSAYYTILDNAMVRRDDALNGQDSIFYDGELSNVQSIQNAATANVYGIQAGLELKLPFGLGFSTDVNFQKGEEELEDGSLNPSRHASPFFGVSRISYRFKKLNIELNSLYQSQRSHSDLSVEEQNKTEIYALNENGETYAPAWYTLNFKSIYEISSLFNISLGIENITDQRYRPYSSGISGPGRNFVLSLNLSF
jgi:hemoglobin/transferrin/lactoferrin receptor protein